MPRLVFIHTVAPLIALFDRLAVEMLPGVCCKHILDEPLLEAIRQRGELSPADSQRLGEHIRQAALIRADAVLVTCSTASPLVDDLRPHFSVPLIKIDEEMIRVVVKGGGRVGILVTNPTTLQPTQHMLEKEAQRGNRAMQFEMLLVEGAFAALISGDTETHDRLVRQAILDFSPRVDRLVLAQASMARVLERLPEAERPVPVISSPHLAMRLIQSILHM